MSEPRLPRTVKLGMRGKDVDAHARALHRYLHDGQLKGHSEARQAVRETFGTGKRTLAKKAARLLELPAYGIVGPSLYYELREAGAYDAKADQLLNEYLEATAPKLVEPVQGFASLHPSLWKAYSRGRRLGFTDLGTYNAASRLPSGSPSDHAVYPAVAFDLGISPATGWNNLKARAFFMTLRLDPNVEYAILGDRIWSRGSIHSYGGGGHVNHIHVSGRR